MRKNKGHLVEGESCKASVSFGDHRDSFTKPFITAFKHLSLTTLLILRHNFYFHKTPRVDF